MRRISHAMVCGLGASGLAAARLLRREGAEVCGVDERDTPELRRQAGELQGQGCTVLLGAKVPPPGEFDLAVISPGLPAEGSFLEVVRGRGIPLVAEMELGWSRFRGRTVAVTGSNGKSSVVKALAGCFEAAGRRAIPCGNYGLPVCQAIRELPDADWLVIEASSFQLETCVAFRPDIGVLLNILPNHLDRHGTLEAYARLKARLFSCQRAGDVALTPPKWRERCREWSGGRGRWLTFGAGPDADVIYRPGHVAAPAGESVDIQGTYFDNEVLGSNAAALFGAACAAGLAPAAVRTALAGFAPLPHRAQWIGESEGVRYVDDSKATNLSAMMASIRMQDRPVWLIAGGRPKEKDFSTAVPVLRERVRGVFLVGEAADAMASAWASAAACEMCGTLDRAVAAARRAAVAGETILLAPACTSYDQYRSYAERGKAFQKGVCQKSDLSF